MTTTTTAPHCAGCETLWAYDALEPVTIGEDVFYACPGCMDELEGPGKHEGIGEDDYALVVVLEYLRGISMEDHWLADESGYVGVFERHLLVEDSQGFVDVRTFTDHQAAMREINSYEDDGMGASEDDAYIAYERNGLYVSFAGKTVGTYETLRRAMAAVSVEMRRQGYFPNVWLTGEHGPTIRRIDVW